METALPKPDQISVAVDNVADYPARLDLAYPHFTRRDLFLVC
jgi:hypothetical protein